MSRRSDGSERRRRRESPDIPTPTEVCYCLGERDLGALELHCAGCRKWFHQRCLRDLTEFYGLPFMVCYIFKCQDCSPDKKESWSMKQTNFSHMCVMALANMTYNHYNEIVQNKKDILSVSAQGPKYFHVEKEIVPFFAENWENLTNNPRRVKNSWHVTLSKTLAKETELFSVNPENESEVGLSELNLLEIGPFHENIKKLLQLGRRPPANQPLPTADSDTNDSDSGPKTRGAAKRRREESSSRTSSMTPTKLSAPSPALSDFKMPVVTIEKPMGLLKKGTLDAGTVVEGMDGTVAFPYNREGMQYFYAEKDVHVPERDKFDNVDPELANQIPAHIYRWQVPNQVVISTNDRAHQLEVSDDRLTVTGKDGYAVARATHFILYGKWYYEVELLDQPEGSHTRIGWCQQLASLQACLGYNQFSYSWRSKKGTRFHNAIGRTYSKEDYRVGDVLGCLIELPERDHFKGNVKGSRLPPTRKDKTLLNYKGRIFFEEKEERKEEVRVVPQPGARITFFKNGVSCGTAFEDINSGAYYPAVSLFHSATAKFNFGPDFKYPAPPGARPICERAEEMAIELALSDMLFLTEKADELQQNVETKLRTLATTN
uniref:B30.2/SPRY domain-containing protein n=1 Tax=Panagrellus redivivus TaxID=6233 RepID=A0A7E4W6F1_PANRE